MQIFEVKYTRFDGSTFAYFQGDYKTAKFYENWIDCKEQNDKLLDSFETDKIRQALGKHFIAIKNHCQRPDTPIDYLIN
jgi:hypothetical protein